MKYYMYCMRDEASGTYLAPQLEATEATAIRNFQYACEKNPIVAFRPADFSLWLVASFDDALGTISTIGPELVKRGESCDV